MFLGDLIWATSASFRSTRYSRSATPETKERTWSGLWISIKRIPSPDLSSPNSSHGGRCLPLVHVVDRIGGGDGFAAGLFYGLLSGRPPEEALRLGWAHGALLTTFPGDVTMARLPSKNASASCGPVS